jgi:hypothetical protein
MKNGICSEILTISEEKQSKKKLNEQRRELANIEEAKPREREEGETGREMGNIIQNANANAKMERKTGGEKKQEGDSRKNKRQKGRNRVTYK